MPDGVVRQLENDLWIIDTLFQGEQGVIASYLLTGAYGLGLIDVGSGASVEQVLSGVRAAGFDPEDIAHVVLTHVHLDHAGATGALVRRIRGARVYVHSLGAPHLVDPSRLWRSASRIYGDSTARLWGATEPVPEERIHVVADEETIQVGSRELQALYTPGHAVHHLAYFDSRTKGLFAGDVAGVRLQGSEFVRPPTPPPDLNLEDWYTSIDRISELRPEVLYLPHYGRFAGEARLHLAELRRRLADWSELMLAGIRENKPDVELANLLSSVADSEIAGYAAGDDTVIRHYEMASNYLMSVQGYIRYFRKVHPELLA